MKTIYKYSLSIVEEQTLTVPASFVPLHVGLDPQDHPCLWGAVDTASPKQTIKVFIVGTGNPLPEGVNLDSSTYHVGSFVQGPFMWHVFMG